MPKKMTQEEFIAKAKEVWGDKYDYSLVKFVNKRTPVDIICPKHGIMQQAPVDHLNGHNCKKCAYETAGNKRKYTQREIIKKIVDVWGQRFDLSEVVYDGLNKPICVICKTHGKFYPTPANLLRGHGCKECALEDQKVLIEGIGINDTLYGSETQSYAMWRNILSRCYNKKELQRHPTYQGCSVSDDWRYFSKFKAWYDANYIDGYEIEKDIIKKGNKVYCEEYCCFVPRRVNLLLVNQRRRRGKYPVGVVKNRLGHYDASIQMLDRAHYLGQYKTPEDAFLAYKRAKEMYIKKVAQEYFNQGLISERVYDALFRYEVEITD